jgi:hypothetical protein
MKLISHLSMDAVIFFFRSYCYRTYPLSSLNRLHVFPTSLAMLSSIIFSPLVRDLEQRWVLDDITQAHFY